MKYEKLGSTENDGSNETVTDLDADSYNDLKQVIGSYADGRDVYASLNHSKDRNNQNDTVSNRFDSLDKPIDPDKIINNVNFHNGYAMNAEENGIGSYNTLVSPDDGRAEIAPGVVAIKSNNYNNTKIVNLVDRNNQELNVASDNHPDLSEKDMALLSAVHASEFRDSFSKKMGLDLKKVSLGSQVQLLRFIEKKNNNDRFERLCKALNGVDEGLRLKLAESFLAADFGEDFGDSLLTIANSERLSNKEKEEILDQIGSCRESIQKIAGLYRWFDDGKFAKQYARAANERLTDALSVFEQIAKNSSAEADLGWPGRMKYDYDTAMEALQYETKSLGIISGVMDDLIERKEGAFAEVALHRDKDNQRLNRTVYNFYSPDYGYVTLYTRREGSHSFDPMVEYGKVRSRYDKTSVNAGVEASISFVVNPVDSFSLPSPFKPDSRALKNPRFYDTATMDKVSAIRIDREGRAPGASANNSDRDPINPVGLASVDLAAINDRADTPSGKIARLFATGNALRARKNGSDSALNHNTKWFEQDKYGTAEGFGEIVDYLDKWMIRLVDLCPPGVGEGFTAMKEQANQKRGKVAMQAVNANQVAETKRTTKDNRAA